MNKLTKRIKKRFKRKHVRRSASRKILFYFRRMNAAIPSSIYNTEYNEMWMPSDVE